MSIRQIRVKVPISLEPDGDGFHAYAPALKGCHVGGATKEEAKRNLDDAMCLYIVSLLERGEALPIGCGCEIHYVQSIPATRLSPETPLPGVNVPVISPAPELSDLSIPIPV